MTISLIHSGNLSSPISSCAIQEEQLNCRLITDGSCDHSMDLGVTCRTYEQLYNELLAGGSMTTIIIAFGTAIGLLIAVIVAMAIGWLCTCVILKRKSTVAPSKNTVR